MGSLVSIAGLEKRFSGFRLEKVNLTVEEGCITGLVGSNGAGKSTTLKALLGLVVPDAGRIELFGEEIFGPAPSGGGYRYASAPDLQSCMEQVGFVPDICPFPQSLPVKDVDALGCAIHPTWDSARFKRLMKDLKLEGKKTVKDLSRGMSMKLSLAVALSFETRLLVLDEATAGLDPMARTEVLDLLFDYVADGERGVLFSTHITSDLEKVADTVVCIDDGRLLFDLPKDELRGRFGIARCRSDQIDRVVEAFGGSSVLALRHAYSVDVLVPDRIDFARRFDGIPCDPVSIEEFMTFYIKGERL